MEKKADIKIMLKEAAILTAITLIAGLILGFVYELTKEPIRIQQEKAVQEACMAVFPGDGSIQFREMDYTVSDSVKNSLSEKGVKIGTVYEALASGSDLAGYVIQSTSSEGYGGNIVLYVGITTEGVLNDISILEIAETPGLGMQAPKVLVPQFHNKKAAQFTYTKTGSKSENEVDAISGATITTKAVTNAVNGALMVADELMGGGLNE